MKHANEEQVLFENLCQRHGVSIQKVLRLLATVRESSAEQLPRKI